MKRAVVLVGHGKIQSTFDRHLPYWKSHHLPIHTISPVNDPVGVGQRVGLSSVEGPEMAKRLKAILETPAELGVDQIIVFEYDSLCLNPPPELPDGLWANCYPNYNFVRFKSPWVLNFPWIIDRRTAATLLETWVKHPDLFEEGWYDRLLGAIAITAEIPINRFGIYGYSRGTIEGDLVKEMAVAISRGAIWIHGIKSEKTLRSAENARPWLKSA